jgi:ribosome-associated heat shock protein Hsp15
VEDLRSTVRADVWLWAARFFKTRSLAKAAIEGGKVALDGEPLKPAKAIHVGDRLTIRRGEELFDVYVVGVSDVRGPASVAQALYEETHEGRAAREARREQSRYMALGAAHPPSRPDKKDRRDLVALKKRR